jgi:hypothetical protein
MVAFQVGASQGDSQVDPPKHLAVAERLVKDLVGSPENVYGGGKRHIEWDQRPLVARTVCSSFVSLLMQHTYGFSEDNYKTWFGEKNPNAAAYHDAIVAKNGFLKIVHVAALRPGDVLAIKYTDGHISKNGVDDTGHVMVVAQAPVAWSGSQVAPAGLRGYVVEVYDSSASGHGDNDTRYLGSKKFSGGIGRGNFTIYADGDDKIAGYAWSDWAKSDFFTSPGRDLVAGRLDFKRLPFASGG